MEFEKAVKKYLPKKEQPIISWDTPYFKAMKKGFNLAQKIYGIHKKGISRKK